MFEDVTSYTYYGPTQTLGAAWNTTTTQAGLLQSATSATPLAVKIDTVYDVLGRAVGARRTGDTDWTCTTLDTRGRPITTTYPASGTTPTRTATYGYTTNDDPLTTWAKDDTLGTGPTDGKITTTTDLLGRTTYTHQQLAEELGLNVYL